MAEAWIALGSNLGNRRQNLAQARRLLAAEVLIVRSSSIIETRPWGYADQPNFLNQVLLCESVLAPQVLLGRLKAIEETLGRTPTFRYGPRLIDLDLLAYGDVILQSPDLTLPHPRMHERAFVLAPLVEIAPDWVHPILKRTALELLDALQTREA